MEEKAAYMALEEVAKQRGITVEEVVHEIDKTIQLAFENVQNTNNKKALEKWKMIPCAGDRPTAVELLSFLFRIIDMKMYQNDPTILDSMLN